MEKTLGPKRKFTTTKTLNRQQQLKEEIYAILHKEAHAWFRIINNREDNLTTRLNAIEQAGVPKNVLEELKHDISGLKYAVGKQTRALQEMFKFFNVTKDILEMPAEEEKSALESKSPQYAIIEGGESLNLESMEKVLVTKALQKHKGNRKAAANELGISERTLYRRLIELKLDL